MQSDMQFAPEVGVIVEIGLRLGETRVNARWKCGMEKSCYVTENLPGKKNRFSSLATFIK